MSLMHSLHRQTPAPRARVAVRLRPALVPVPAQQPADPRCDYIPVPPVGYDDEGYPVEDSVTQSQRHMDQTVDSYAALRDWCRRRALGRGARGDHTAHEEALGDVFSDLLMPYLRGQKNKVVSPDLMVSLQAERREERTSYRLWENPTPEFVLESLSNSTWKADVGEKKRLYRSLGVREYWLFDNAGKRIPEQLRGYRLRRRTHRGYTMHVYALVRPNRWGRRASEVLGLELCVQDGDLRFYDPEAEEFLLRVRESHVRAREADAERTARQAAERHAEAERVERQAAERRAEAERVERRAAERRIAALEAQLQALRKSD